jgi:hypothetical protein
MPSLGSMTTDQEVAGSAVVVVALAGSVGPGPVVVDRLGATDDVVGAEEDVRDRRRVGVVVCGLAHDVATSTTPIVRAERRNRKRCPRLGSLLPRPSGFTLIAAECTQAL